MSANTKSSFSLCEKCKKEGYPECSSCKYKERYYKIMNAKVSYERAIEYLGWDSHKNTSGKRTYMTEFSEYPQTVDEILVNMYKGIEETKKRMNNDSRSVDKTELKFSDMKIK